MRTNLPNKNRKISMKYQLNIELSEQDYIEFNEFCLLRSHYKMASKITGMRGLFAMLVAVLVMSLLIRGDFSTYAFLSIIPLLILFVVLQLCLSKPFFVRIIKKTVDAQKKSGKMAFSPSAVMEFYEDGFVETTSDSKTEQKYERVERISVVDNKMIYIHTNSITAYIVPVSCFESKEQCGEFIEFLKTKCENIDVYQK